MPTLTWHIQQSPPEGHREGDPMRLQPGLRIPRGVSLRPDSYSLHSSQAAEEQTMILLQNPDQTMSFPGFQKHHKTFEHPNLPDRDIAPSQTMQF